MYVKDGFIDFIDRNTPIGTSTYGKSLTATEDGGAISSTHRRLGTKDQQRQPQPAAFAPATLTPTGPA